MRPVCRNIVNDQYSLCFISVPKQRHSKQARSRLDHQRVIDYCSSEAELVSPASLRLRHGAVCRGEVVSVVDLLTLLTEQCFVSPVAFVRCALSVCCRLARASARAGAGAPATACSAPTPPFFFVPAFRTVPCCACRSIRAEASGQCRLMRRDDHGPSFSVSEKEPVL